MKLVLGLLGWWVGLWSSITRETCNGVRLLEATALVRASLVVAGEVNGESGVHLLDGLEAGTPDFGPEVLVEAARLPPLHLGEEPHLRSAVISASG